VVFPEELAARPDVAVFLARTRADAEALRALGLPAVERPQEGAWPVEDFTPLRGRKVVLVGRQEQDETGWGG
jgi:hypothetical protein